MTQHDAAHEWQGTSLVGEDTAELHNDDTPPSESAAPLEAASAALLEGEAAAPGAGSSASQRAPTRSATTTWPVRTTM